MSAQMTNMNSVVCSPEYDMLSTWIMTKEGGPEADDTLGSSTRIVALVACCKQ